MGCPYRRTTLLSKWIRIIFLKLGVGYSYEKNCFRITSVPKENFINGWFKRFFFSKKSANYSNTKVSLDEVLEEVNKRLGKTRLIIPATIYTRNFYIWLGYLKHCIGDIDTAINAKLSY